MAIFSRNCEDRTAAFPDVVEAFVDVALGGSGFRRDAGLIVDAEIVGIDIEDDMGTILSQLASSQHTRLPVYKDDIDNMLGILHLRRVARFLPASEMTKAECATQRLEPGTALPRRRARPDRRNHLQLCARAREPGRRIPLLAIPTI